MTRSGKNTIAVELQWKNLKGSLERFELDMNKGLIDSANLFGKEIMKTIPNLSNVVNESQKKLIVDSVKALVSGSDMMNVEAGKWVSTFANAFGSIDASQLGQVRVLMQAINKEASNAGINVGVAVSQVYNNLLRQATENAKHNKETVQQALKDIVQVAAGNDSVVQGMIDKFKNRLIELSETSKIPLAQVNSIFTLMSQKSNQSGAEIDAQANKMFDKLLKLAHKYGVAIEEVASIYESSLKKADNATKAMDDTTKKASKTFQLQLSDVKNLSTAWTFAGQAVMKWLAPLVLLKIGWDAVSNAITNAMKLTNMYGMTAKVALGTVQSMMRMSSKGLLDYEVVGNTVVMLGNFNKNLIDIDKSSGKLSSDSEKLVANIVKVSAVTGASIESLTQLTNTMISTFKLSRDEMAEFAKQLGGYTGLTSTEVNNVTTALKDYGDELIRIHGAEGQRMMKDNRKEILNSMASLSTAAKVLGIEQKDMLKLQLELRNPTNIDKFQRLGIDNMSKYSKMFLGNVDEQLAALTEIGQKMSEAYGGKDSAWVEKAMRGMNLDRVFSVKLAEAELRKKEVVDLGKVVDLNKRYEESLSNVNTFMKTLKGEFAVMMSEVIIPALKPLAIIWNWLMKYPAVMKAIIATVVALTIAVTAFNVVLWACPLTWVAALIVGIIAGIVLLIVYWDDVVKSFKLAGSHFVSFGESVAKVGTMVWDKIVMAFYKMVPIVKDIGDTILKWFLAPINAVVAAVKIISALFNAIVHWEWAGFGAKIRAIIMNMFPAWIQTLINNWIGGSKEVPAAAAAGANVTATGNVAVPALASGTDRVLQTGAAIVHKDEAVAPAGTIGEISKNLAVLVELLKMYIPSIASNTRGGSVNDYLMSMGAVSGKV